MGGGQGVGGGGRKGEGVVRWVKGGGDVPNRGTPHLINVGNSQHTFVASPDNESFLKKSRHRVMHRFFVFVSRTRLRINANRDAGAQHWLYVTPLFQSPSRHSYGPRNANALRHYNLDLNFYSVISCVVCANCIKKTKSMKLFFSYSLIPYNNPCFNC